MTDPIREQLSAFADGELSAEEQRFLLRRLAQDGELCGRYGRYELIRSCLRGQHVAYGADLVARVMSAIGDEPVARTRQRWLRPVLGGAVAAAVAALALVLITPPPAVDDTAGAPAVVASTGLREQDLRPTLVAQPVAGRVGGPVAGTVAMPDPQLEAYLLRHGNAAMAAPRGGFVPYVYVVASPVVRAGAQPAPGPFQASQAAPTPQLP
jgi:anti-sigma factor RsiW